jgi:hypothetical protein
MPKKIANKEREIKRQKKEAKTTQQTTIIANENIMRIQKQVEIQEKTIFNNIWSLSNVREARNRLHM